MDVKSLEKMMLEVADVSGPTEVTAELETSKGLHVMAVVQMVGGVKKLAVLPPPTPISNLMMHSLRGTLPSDAKFANLRFCVQLDITAGTPEEFLEHYQEQRIDEYVKKIYEIWKIHDIPF